ncbi:MAG: SurA N-terminal domain-containing protein [Bacteroidales bacterium]
MAVLEKIRVKMGLFITVIIGVALLSFIIDADTFRSAVSRFSNKYDVGRMYGKSISYQDFQKRVDYFNHIHQLLTGGEAANEQVSEMISQSAWQDLFNERVILPAVKKSGIAVGHEELYSLTQGSEISPILQQEQLFVDETGQFSRERFAEFIKAIPDDASGNLESYWGFLEKNILEERLLSKYFSLLRATNFTNPLQLRRAIEESNITSDLSFIIQPYAFSSDSTIKVSNREIKEYYNSHKKDFERSAGRDIEYVLIEVLPSQEDIMAAQNEIEGLMEQFRSSTNLRNFLARNSDKPLNRYYYKKGELSAISEKLDHFAFSATSTNQVLEPYKEGEVFRAARVVESKVMPDSVFVQHIMLQEATQEVAHHKADSLMQLLSKGASFTHLAEENSVDKNPSANQAGDIGWMTQKNIIPGFDTCFVLPLNRPIKLITEYGTHIVKIKERTSPHKRVQLAILEKEIVAGKPTYQSYYSKANEVASKADGKIELFNKVSEELSLKILQANNIVEGSKTIAGYDNAREIVRWLYDEKTKEGSVSQVISVDNRYFFVVAVKEVREEGVAPLAAVESEISSILTNQKRKEKLIKTMRGVTDSLTTLEQVSELLKSGISTQNGISFGSQGSRFLDPTFIGAATAAPEQTLQGPVEGKIGLYFFRVDSRETGAFFTEDDAKERVEFTNQYHMQILPKVYEVLADVKDWRVKFF